MRTGTQNTQTIKMSSISAANKRIFLEFFEYAYTGSYMSPSQWRDLTDRGHTKDRLEYLHDRL
jgi:hypothetical protein